MKVKGYEVFKCDAGWRTFSFLKLVTDDDPHIYGQPFRSPNALPVTFDPT